MAKAKTAKIILPNCTSCGRDEVIEAASMFCRDCLEAICDTCAKLHKRNKFLLNHKLVNINGLEAEQIRETLSSSDDIDGREDSCREHNKKFKYICETHDIDLFCCSRCAVESHRHCKDLMHLSEYTKQERFTTQMAKSECDLIQLSEYAKDVLKYEGDHVQRISTFQQTEMEKIDDIQTKLKTLIDKVFAERKAAIVENANKICDKSEQVQDQVNECLTEIDETLSLHGNAKSSSSEVFKVITVNFVADTEKKLEDRLKSLSKTLSSEVIVTEFDNTVQYLRRYLDRKASVQVQKISTKPPILKIKPAVPERHSIHSPFTAKTHSYQLRRTSLHSPRTFRAMSYSDIRDVDETEIGNRSLKSSRRERSNSVPRC